MSKIDINPDRLPYNDFLKACPAAQQFSSNFKYPYVNGNLGNDGQGRIIDAGLSVAEWMADHNNAMELCLATKSLDQSMERCTRTVFLFNII